MRALALVDVFTAEPFHGNPVAVVLDGEGLSAIGCASSRRSPSCRSPGTRRSAAAMRGWTPAVGPSVDAQWVDNGPGWVAVMLASAAEVLALAPGLVDLDLGVVGAYPPGAPEAFEVRAFFPKDGSCVEDPVTGSLNASLAQWLISSGRANAPYVVSQGTALGRAGRVHIAQDAGGTIWVGGGTITCARGEVDV
jgi:predicted PhzF superfamily epimerase YddE/YHI9